MDEIQEQSSFEFSDKIKLFEDYKYSEYSDVFINSLNKKSKSYIQNLIQICSNAFQIDINKKNIDLICKFILAFIKTRDKSEKGIFFHD